MKDKTTITITINEADLQCNLSRNTTCDDVIKMATRNISSSNGSKVFAIFESAFGVQKMLPGQTKLLKQVRSWGADKYNFSLEVREVDKIKSKMASITRAKTKLQRLRSLIMKHELKASQKLETYLHDNLGTNAVNKDKHYFDKSITVIEETDKRIDNQVNVNGKRELLKRYLHDSKENNVTSVKDFNEIHYPVRTSGVGIENDSDSESELPERTSADGEESIDYSTEADEEQDMNNAFIFGETVTEPMFYTSIDNDELNECILYDTDCTHSEGDESAFVDDSDYASVCELERNITGSYNEDTYTNISELKRIFSNGDLNARITEDELLDSFMNTFVHNEDSDEGMSSVHSDFE